MEEHLMTEMIKHGTIIRYNIDNVVTGKGRICGIAAQPQPVIGYGYIVEDLSGKVPSTTYPFSHFVVFEPQIVDRDVQI